MLASIDLFVLEVIVTLELRVASSHRVGGFQQIVTKISVTRFDQVCRFGLIIARLVLRPNESGIFGKRGVRIETANISDFRNDTGRIDFSNSRNIFSRDCFTINKNHCKVFCFANLIIRGVISYDRSNLCQILIGQSARRVYWRSAPRVCHFMQCNKIKKYKKSHEFAAWWIEISKKI